MERVDLFYIFGKNVRNGGVAKDSKFNSGTLYFLRENQRITDWELLQCEIIEGAGFYDYQANTHGFRLCSQKLKDVLENGKNPEDKIQWLEATITWNNETRLYYVLHFYETVDVFDYERSGWDGKFFNKPKVFLKEKIKNHNVFSTYVDSLCILVKPEIIKEIKRQKLTGMVYEIADVV
jgi:ribosomal protein L24E